MSSSDEALVRRFARAAEPLHSCTYYAEEINQFNKAGYNGWWHAYFAYRSAPMGTVSSREVTEVFYNFAPRMVERAVPSCWEILDPNETRTLHLQLVESALSRIFSSYEFTEPLEQLVEALKPGLARLSHEGRPLFGAWIREDWPQHTILAFWHASTLLREYRFDAHNQALRNAGISGLGCHLLMVADGRGTPGVIQRIRGWTQDEWDSEAADLRERGWLDAQMEYTPSGRAQRKAIETETDRGCLELCSAIENSVLMACLEALERVAQYLIDSAVVPGRWPPAHLGKLDSSPMHD